MLKGDLFVQWKMGILDTCVIPFLTYGSQLWSMTKGQRESLRKTYFRILRSILRIRIKDKIKLEEIVECTGANDIGWKTKKLKLSFARHMVRGEDK